MGIRSKVRAWLHDDKAIRALHKRVYSMGVEQCTLRDHVSRLVNENQDLKLKVQHLEADLKAARGSVSAIEFMYKDLEGRVIKNAKAVKAIRDGQFDQYNSLCARVSAHNVALDELGKRVNTVDNHTEEIDHKVGGLLDAFKPALNRLKLLEIGRGFWRSKP